MPDCHFTTIDFNAVILTCVLPAVSHAVVGFLTFSVIFSILFFSVSFVYDLNIK